MPTVASRRERARKETPEVPAASTNKLSEDDIRLLAYHLYERRCASGIEGDASGDWIRAEQLLSNGEAASSTRGN
jgi:cytochrome c553